MALTLTIDGNLSENVCKLYLNQNLVIIHPSEFKKKEEVVDYAVNLMKDKKMTDFKGNILKKDVKESDNSKGLKRQ